MTSGTPLRALALALLVLAAPLWVAPHGAFHAGEVDRSAIAPVVADSAAYIKIAGATCSVPVAGGTCTLTFTNQAPRALQFTITLAGDLLDNVGEYNFPDRTPVTSGPMSTTGEIAAGSDAPLTVHANACACNGQVRIVTWDLSATHNNDMDARRNGLMMTLEYRLV